MQFNHDNLKDFFQFQCLTYQRQGDDFLSLIWPDFVGVFIRDMHFNYENIKDFITSSNV